MHPLDKVRLKLDRAEEHLGTLNDEMREFLSLKPYRIEPHDPLPIAQFIETRIGAPGPSIGTMRVIHDPPVRLSLIIGDYVHNLRSALDHLVWQLSLLTTQTPKPRTQFPIFDKRVEGIEGRIKDWTWDVPDEARDVIVGLQPYNRSGYEARHYRFDPLWQIGELDGIDKHAAALVTVFSETLVTHYPDGGRITTFFENPLQDGDPVFPDLLFGTQVAGTNFGTNDESKVYVEPAYGVLVEESPRLVLPINDLRQLQDHVDARILPRFTRFFE